MEQNARMHITNSHSRSPPCFYFSGLPPQGQQLPSAITTDPPPDKAYPATMEAPDILSHGARLNSVFYLASGIGPHPTVLLFHGFPGNEKNMDLAYAIQRAGWNVLFPTIAVPGEAPALFLLPTQSKIRNLQSIFCAIRQCQEIPHRPEKIVLIGHSMGGFMAALRAALMTHKSAGVAMICGLEHWPCGPALADNGRSDNSRTLLPVSREPHPKD